MIVTGGPRWILGCLLALGGCAVPLNTTGPALRTSVSLPAWTQLNGAALRRTQPQSIEILVEEPSEFRTVVDPFQLKWISPLAALVRGTDVVDDFDSSHMFVSDPAPRAGKMLARVLAKRFQLTIRGIRASDADPFSMPSDLSLYVGTIDWAIDCTGYQKPDSHSEESPTCAVIYRVAVRLEDNRKKELVAAGNCQTAPMRRFLEAGEDPDAKVNVPLVNSALKEAVADCVDNLRRDPLGIYGSVP